MIRVELLQIFKLKFVYIAYIAKAAVIMYNDHIIVREWR